MEPTKSNEQVKSNESVKTAKSTRHALFLHYATNDPSCKEAAEAAKKALIDGGYDGVVVVLPDNVKLNAVDIQSVGSGLGGE